MFFDKYAKKKSSEWNEITYFLIASKNITDSDHVCHVIVYRYFLIRLCDCDVWIKLFLSSGAISIVVRDFFF